MVHVSQGQLPRHVAVLSQESVYPIVAVPALGDELAKGRKEPCRVVRAQRHLLWCVCFEKGTGSF